MNTKHSFASTSSLSADELKLETEGRYHDLIELLVLKPSQGSIDVRLARAHALSGDAVRASQIVERLKVLSLSTSDRAYISLAEASLARQQGDWEKAEQHSQVAVALARKTEDPQLLGDSQFALGIAHCELGQVFSALDLFDQVRTNLKISGYRRSLSALNQSWILWDLGRVESVRTMISEIPLQYSARISLYLEMHDGNWQQISSQFLDKGCPPDLPPSERFYTVFGLVLAAEVLGGGARGLTQHPAWDQWAMNWILTELKKAQDSEEFKGSAEAALRLLQFQVQIQLPSNKRARLNHWRSQLSEYLLKVLHQTQTDPAQAAIMYQAQIDPILRERLLATPLIPKFELLTERALSPWHIALSGRLWILRSQDIFASIDGLQLEVRHAGGTQRVDFTKSPVSVKVLTFLIGKNGTRFNKRYIHEKLTSSRYSSVLHDNRIHQLLSRLAKRLSALGIPPLWTLPGDNAVLLQCDLKAAGGTIVKK